MKLKPAESLITLFKFYVDSCQFVIAKEVASQIEIFEYLDIQYLLNKLEMWVRLGEYERSLDTISQLSKSEYSPEACELCRQLVKFRLNKIENANDALICAKVLFENKMISETEQVLQNALQSDGFNINIKAYLAKFYLDIGNISKSESLAKEIIETEETNAIAWSVHGNVLRLMGNVEDSYIAHQKALALDSEIYESLLDVTAIEVSRSTDKINFDQCITSSNRCLQVFMRKNYKFSDLDASLCKIKHDNAQAKYLLEYKCMDNLMPYISITDQILSQMIEPISRSDYKLSEIELSIINDYNKLIHICDQYYDPGTYLNPDLDWRSISEIYKSSTPSLVVIDDFLNVETLEYLRKFCHESKVWHKTYQQAYLGAFMDKGFISRVHMNISQELKTKLPDVIQQDQLEQLWAFKYDSHLGKGINVHADFARINLNFWITPDEFNLSKDNGGMIVYSEPAPRDWNYVDYNINAKKIYEYLDLHNSRSVTIPYKANRAVLFDSTLFHETDEIKFVDSYLGRRINMTYLFGVQLN